jgi:hypothetical protein
MPYYEGEKTPSIEFCGRKSRVTIYCCMHCAVDLMNYIGKREEAHRYEYEEKKQ